MVNVSNMSFMFFRLCQTPQPDIVEAIAEDLEDGDGLLQPYS